ncbi:hypothetical protein F5144DRAFT_43238 [Chaetomium tenue]|uniref:Uncharacterized protein n=1 Tax=Chaetomium tenue TaxID=1854479 RepID=A0ACB7PNN0_9PEZI|nr:hypothetical protein F5144DRAFT_43238 [Chaetomium globosum]
MGWFFGWGLGFCLLVVVRMGGRGDEGGEYPWTDTLCCMMRTGAWTLAFISWVWQGQYYIFGQELTNNFVSPNSQQVDGKSSGVSHRGVRKDVYSTLPVINGWRYSALQRRLDLGTSMLSCTCLFRSQVQS